jgi:hypothetical protein
MVEIGGSLIAARDLPDDRMLTREQAAAALTEFGFPTAVLPQNLIRQGQLAIFVVWA